jgi:hypothetical protein
MPGKIETQTIVGPQFFQSDRDTTPFKVFRCSHYHHSGFTQLTGYQVGITERTISDSHISMLSQQVDHLIRQR